MLNILHVINEGIYLVGKSMYILYIVNIYINAFWDQNLSTFLVYNSKVKEVAPNKKFLFLTAGTAY